MADNYTNYNNMSTTLPAHIKPQHTKGRTITEVYRNQVPGSGTDTKHEYVLNKFIKSKKKLCCTR